MDSDKVRFERWQKYYRRVAAEYEMEQGKDSPTGLKLRPEPVFTYANPAGGQRSHGAMFNWTCGFRENRVGRSESSSSAIVDIRIVGLYATAIGYVKPTLRGCEDSVKFSGPQHRQRVACVSLRRDFRISIRKETLT